MAATTKDSADSTIEKLSAPPIPFLTVTFKGDYYRAAGGGKGKDYVPFEKVVKVPLSAISYENHRPIGFFRRYHEDRLMKKLGGVGIRTVELTEVVGDLPKGMSFERQLDWTADYDKLKEIASNVGLRRYLHTDLKTDEKTQESVTINILMFPSATQLRDAINLIIAEPEAFAREQKKLEERDALAPKNMEADIAAFANE